MKKIHVIAMLALGCVAGQMQADYAMALANAIKLAPAADSLKKSVDKSKLSLDATIKIAKDTRKTKEVRAAAAVAAISAGLIPLKNFIKLLTAINKDIIANLGDKGKAVSDKFGPMFAKAEDFSKQITEMAAVLDMLAGGKADDVDTSEDDSSASSLTFD